MAHAKKKKVTVVKLGDLKPRKDPKGGEDYMKGKKRG
jgi:hypothetical protein